MIGNIETVEVKIDADTFQLTKLYAKNSYELYLRCLGVLSPFFSLALKDKKTFSASLETGKIKGFDLNSNIESALNIIIEKFGFNEVIHLLQASNIKRNYKEIKEADWNVASPILIMELFAHVIKINVVSELAKKDFSQIVHRLFGSQNSQES